MLVLNYCVKLYCQIIVVLNLIVIEEENVFEPENLLEFAKFPNLRSLTLIGGFKDLDIEGLQKLRPDIVITKRKEE